MAAPLALLGLAGLYSHLQGNKMRDQELARQESLIEKLVGMYGNTPTPSEYPNAVPPVFNVGGGLEAGGMEKVTPSEWPQATDPMGQALAGQFVPLQSNVEELPAAPLSENTTTKIAPMPTRRPSLLGRRFPAGLDSLLT